MRRVLLYSTLAATLTLSACEDGSDILIIDEPSSTLLVENNADEGEGSLRAALETASSDPEVNSIQVTAGVGTVTLTGSLEYTGSQALRIVGNGVVLDGSGCACDVLVSTGGADLDLFDVTLKEGNHGLRMQVPEGTTDEVSLRLVRVTTEDNQGHGIYVSEAGSGTAAGLRVEFVTVTARRNGFAEGTEDLDGIRVDEAGDGTLTFLAGNVEATENAGDGVELNEAGNGHLVADVQDSSFDDNGEQPQSPSAPEDGFDAGEAGAGSLDVRLLSSTANGNHEQGVELTESGAGDLRATLTGLQASENGGDNLQLTEDEDARGGSVPGAGGITATLSDVTAQDAEDDGAQIEELGAGDVNAQIQDADFSDNAGDGLTVSQGGTGRGQLLLVRVVTDGNGGLPLASEGTSVTEGSDQTTTARVRTDEDEGFGSFRSALELATEDDGISTILFESGIGTIDITRALEFGGSQDLLIRGAGAVVDAEDADGDAFQVTGSGSLTLEELSLRNAPGNGITVTGGGDLTLRRLAVRDVEGHGVAMDVPSEAEDLVTVTLDEAVILDNGLHGVWIDDLADAGGGGTGANSAAGLLLVLEGATVQGNGFRQDVTDRGGIRMEEGGSGGVEIRMTDSQVASNAGDGVGVREEGLGGIVLDLLRSTVDGNGSQPQNPDELEDGLDLAEVGPGGVSVEFKGTEARTASLQNNGDMGLEITEEGSGNVVLELTRLLATGNGTGSMAVTEDTDAEGEPTEGAGSLTATLATVTAGQSGEEGIRLTEHGVGDLSLTARGLSSSDNGSDGLRVRELGIGNLTLDVKDSFFDGNGRQPVNPEELEDGVEIAERGPGTLQVELENTSVQNNGGTGMEITEEGSGDVITDLSVIPATGNDGGTLYVVEDADAEGDPEGGSGGLTVTLDQVTGGQTDGDGVTLKELGAGDLSLTARTLDASDNGARGLAVEETGEGKLTVDVQDSFFDDNGALATGPEDPSDGVEIREGEDGTADVRFLNTSASRNAGDGLDAVEDGVGDLRGTLTVLTATSNGQDNVRLAEDADEDGEVGSGEGALYLAFTELTATGAAGDGVRLAEYQDGNLTGQMAQSSIGGNGDNGIDASQAGDGEGQLQLVDVTVSGNVGENVATEGVTVTEPGSGDGGT